MLLPLTEEDLYDIGELCYDNDPLLDGAQIDWEAIAQTVGHWYGMLIDPMLLMQSYQQRISLDYVTQQIFVTNRRKFVQGEAVFWIGDGI